jgi:23S rRNA pseudouridine2605 synthase
VTDDGVRLQKVLAAAGIGSRRACEELIAQGRVEVDGRIVREQGLRVDPLRAIVRVDGERVPTAPDTVVLALNKPRGVVTAMVDDLGRPCVGDYVTERTERLFHVGRLDSDTEGLLLLTNDGVLAQNLAHPSHGVAKTYVALVPGPIPRDVGRQLRAGVELDDGPASVDSFAILEATPNKALVEVVLHEGRNHIVRRLLQAVGHPVEELVRTQVGPIRLGQLRPGRTRVVTGPELHSLYTAAGL